MPTLEEIQEKIKMIDGASKLLGRREIKELPSILWEDETVEKLVQGAYNNNLGILVATNKRLIFIDKGLLGMLKVEDFPYDKISSIQYETRLLLGLITIYASGNKAEIKNVQKDQVKGFCEYVRARMTGVQTHASAPQTVAATDTDVISQLERLAKLKEQGVLSETEFATQKEKILGQ